ncbi:hypothetical protein BHM03_00051174, partial [Ensete ventricosum]
VYYKDCNFLSDPYQSQALKGTEQVSEPNGSIGAQYRFVGGDAGTRGGGLGRTRGRPGGGSRGARSGGRGALLRLLLLLLLARRRGGRLGGLRRRRDGDRGRWDGGSRRWKQCRRRRRGRGCHRHGRWRSRGGRSRRRRLGGRGDGRRGSWCARRGGRGGSGGRGRGAAAFGWSGGGSGSGWLGGSGCGGGRGGGGGSGLGWLGGSGCGGGRGDGGGLGRRVGGRREAEEGDAENGTVATHREDECSRHSGAEGSTRGSRRLGNHSAPRGNRMASSWRDRIAGRAWLSASLPPLPYARFCCKSTPVGCSDRTTARGSTVSPKRFVEQVSVDETGSLTDRCRPGPDVGLAEMVSGLAPYANPKPSRRLPPIAPHRSADHGGVNELLLRLRGRYCPTEPRPLCLLVLEESGRPSCAPREAVSVHEGKGKPRGIAKLMSYNRSSIPTSLPASSYLCAKA